MTRLFDAVISAAGLILLAPLLAAVALAVKLSSPGPVFHRAIRVGRNGVLFDLYKFRSMHVTQGGPFITKAGDPRVTATGRLLRRTKIDELPQLVNVLKGEMSLVGPRPEDPRYVAMYDAGQRRILSVRPGLTSPASLSFASEEDQLVGDDWERFYVERLMPEKLRIDLAYLERRSFWSDLGIIARTIAAVLVR